MGKKTKPRMIPKQDGRIIGSICVCQLTMVLSGVALVYLSVAVYAPSHRAFHSGINPVPVMCETVWTGNAPNCTNVTCGEWCLTKTSGFCPAIRTIVRRNGSSLTLNGCTLAKFINCVFGDTLERRMVSGALLTPKYKKFNVEPLTRWNCNKDECHKMRGLYNCTMGQCTNFSEVWNCHPKASGAHINVDKDSSKLSGLYECLSAHRKTRCTQVMLKKDLGCHRVCPKIATTGMNVYIQRGEGVLVASCSNAIASDSSAPGPVPAPFWKSTDGSVIVSCYTYVYNKTTETIVATDCVNGTLVRTPLFPEPIMNFTQFQNLWTDALNNESFEKPRSNEIRRESALLPQTNKLAFFNKSSLLMINTKGCVNTLRGECLQFMEDYGLDGRNFSFRSRYPCYYNKNDPTVVVARFDLDETFRELMIAAFVPAILFVISLTTLCAITRSVKVGDDAKLRCLTCCTSDNPNDVEGLCTTT